MARRMCGSYSSLEVVLDLLDQPALMNLAAVLIGNNIHPLSSSFLVYFFVKTIVLWTLILEVEDGFLDW